MTAAGGRKGVKEVNDEIQELGGWIRSRRRSAGLSQAELAALIGIRRETLAKYETGKIDMPVSQYLKLRRVLDGSEYREPQLTQRAAIKQMEREFQMGRKVLMERIDWIEEGYYER